MRGLEADVHEISADLRERCLDQLYELGIEKVLIWGYKYQHTYHFIHLAFFRAFEWLCADTDVQVTWLDHRDDFPPETGAKTLVLTMMDPPRIDEPIRIDPSTVLWIHKSGEQPEWYERYLDAHAQGRVLFYDEFRRMRRYRAESTYPLFRKLTSTLLAQSGEEQLPVVADHDVPLHWHVPSLGQVTMTWGSDLLPHEIADRVALVPELVGTQAASDEVSWVGSVWNPNYELMADFAVLCQSQQLRYLQYGEYVIDEFVEALRKRGLQPDEIVHKRYISVEENVEITARSRFAPAIQGTNQLASDNSASYVPCRLYKNMSYGGLGMSNNETARLLFGDLVAVQQDLGALLEDGYRLASDRSVGERIVEGMRQVAANHTYLSRIDLLLRATLARRAYCV